MAFPATAIGGVFLDGVQFTTDPDPYEPLNWKKRVSRHMTIGGLVTVQDFGLHPADNMIRLGSGGGNRFLEEATVIALRARYQTLGGTWTFTDWLGNIMVVFIEDFAPVPLKKGGDGAGGNVSLYTYTMPLWVISISQLFGQPYP